jgi:hypothetical protein
MRKILVALLLTYGLTSVGQHNFIWDVTDSTTKTKNEIYSDIKLFIATKWNSAQSVIQNDDKDAGIILIKGIQPEHINTMMIGTLNYKFSYTVTFKMKDYKYKITLNNVYCDRAYSRDGDVIKIDPINYKSQDFIVPSEDKVESVVKTLENDLYALVVDFLKDMKAAKTKKDDW